MNPWVLKLIKPPSSPSPDMPKITCTGLYNISIKCTHKVLWHCMVYFNEITNFRDTCPFVKLLSNGWVVNVYFEVCALHKEGQWPSQYRGKGAECPPLTEKKLSKIGKKRETSGKNREKEEKSGRKGQNREGSFTLPLLTNRAGYDTEEGVT